MAPFGFEVGVFHAYFVEFFTELHIVFVEEVGFADGDPVELEPVFHLDLEGFVEVGVDLRGGLFVGEDGG